MHTALSAAAVPGVAAAPAPAAPLLAENPGALTPASTPLMPLPPELSPTSQGCPLRSWLTDTLASTATPQVSPPLKLSPTSRGQASPALLTW
eukprot:scaffold186358_cov10-Tisochrysis_lutea.AAC.1